MKLVSRKNTQSPEKTLKIHEIPSTLINIYGVSLIFINAYGISAIFIRVYGNCINVYHFVKFHAFQKNYNIYIQYIYDILVFSVCFATQ